MKSYVKVVRDYDSDRENVVSEDDDDGEDYRNKEGVRSCISKIKEKSEDRDRITKRRRHSSGSDSDDRDSRRRRRKERRDDRRDRHDSDSDEEISRRRDRRRDERDDDRREDRYERDDDRRKRNHRRYEDDDRRRNDTRSDRKNNNERAPQDSDIHRDGRLDDTNTNDKGSNDASEAVEQVVAEPVKEKPAKTKMAIGAYIPPSKLREMQAGIVDKNSKEYQRMSWEALKKSINGLINKVNTQNIEFIVTELIRENIVRGRGLVAQTIIRAQVQSPTFTSVYAAFVAIVNTKFPKIGELILRRLIVQFRKAYKRNDKFVCINSVKFIAHLVNQQVAHELLALQILTLMLHNHTGDSVEVAVSFLKDVGQKLLEVSPKGVNAVFERLRNILHDSQTEKRVQYMIEVLFHVRRDNFSDFPTIPEDLDKVEDEEQITHLLQLDDEGGDENILNVFKFDPEYVQNEEKYNQIKKTILDDSDDESDDDEDGDDEDESDDEDEEEGEGGEEKKQTQEIIDMTQTNLIALRRKIFLTIQSSLEFEECAHKMMKIEIKEGQQHEFCLMVVEACMQDRSYQKFFGNLAHRFCLLRREFMDQYCVIFKEQYDNCHHLDTNKLRNNAKLFGHLLWSDAIPWSVLECISLNEEETTSSSRIFIKILFQEISEFLGVEKLLKRLKDPTISPYLNGLFPRDDPVKTRFAINFFTAIGLGVITTDLREHLKTMPKVSAAAQKMAAAAAAMEDSSSSSSSSSSVSDSSSSSSSSSSSESSDNEANSERTKKEKRGGQTRDRKKTRESPNDKKKTRESPNDTKKKRRRSRSR